MAQGWVDRASFLLSSFFFFFPRCYISIKAPKSCTLVFWELLLLCCVNLCFELGRQLELFYIGKQVCCFLKYEE